MAYYLRQDKKKKELICRCMKVTGAKKKAASWFRGQELIALLIMLGSPTTPASYVMSKNMGHDGTLSASCVAATTLFSAVTMTLWIYVLSAGGFLA